MSSSNFREVNNLVNRIINVLDKGVLHDTELYVFTYKWVFESAFFQVTSNIPLFFDSVLQIHEIQMEGMLSLHMVYSTFTRKI